MNDDQSSSHPEGTAQQDANSPSDTAAPAGTTSVARQLLSPRAQQSSSSKAKPKSRSQSNSMSSGSSSHAVPSPRPEAQAKPDLEFEFASKESSNDIEEAGDAKRSFEQIDDDNDDTAGGGHRSLIENMYGVERRKDQPQKRVKTSKDQEEKAAVVKKGSFAVSGNSGLGEWMKEGKGKSDTPSTGTPDIVDLTIGKDCHLPLDLRESFC